jgi:hypothetical protein
VSNRLMLEENRAQIAAISKARCLPAVVSA